MLNYITISLLVLNIACTATTQEESPLIRSLDGTDLPEEFHKLRDDIHEKYQAIGKLQKITHDHYEKRIQADNNSHETLLNLAHSFVNEPPASSELVQAATCLVKHSQEHRCHEIGEWHCCGMDNVQNSLRNALKNTDNVAISDTSKSLLAKLAAYDQQEKEENEKREASYKAVDQAFEDVHGSCQKLAHKLLVQNLYALKQNKTPTPQLDKDLQEANDRVRTECSPSRYREGWVCPSAINHYLKLLSYY